MCSPRFRQLDLAWVLRFPSRRTRTSVTTRKIGLSCYISFRYRSKEIKLFKLELDINANLLLRHVSDGLEADLISVPHCYKTSKEYHHKTTRIYSIPHIGRNIAYLAREIILHRKLEYTKLLSWWHSEKQQQDKQLMTISYITTCMRTENISESEVVLLLLTSVYN